MIDLLFIIVAFQIIINDGQNHNLNAIRNVTRGFGEK